MRTLHTMPPARLERATAPSFFFSGPTGTLLAEDDGEAISGRLCDRERWLPEIEQLLRARSREHPRVAVGAVPFAESAPVRLFCPTRVATWGRTHESNIAASTGTSISPRAASLRAEPSLAEEAADDAFVAAVAEASAAIRQGVMKKVVLARAKDVTLQVRPRLDQLLGTLRAQNPHGFTYALRLAASEQPAGATLVGASPELLLSRRGTTVVSVPLAGSVPRAADAQEDGERARRLLRSAKDRYEHHLVVEQVVESLRPFTEDLRFAREPSVTGTPSMWHLATRVEGTLRDRAMSSLRLALSLHPTPAVCGLPVSVAHAFIRKSESFDRGYFTGTLGYMDANGDGDWIVTIRCAELSGLRARVFAGAGIVGSSVPELELAETNGKMHTMLSALGWESPARLRS